MLATTLWFIQFKTNYHLGETRALAAISRTGLATAVSEKKWIIHF